MQGLGASAEVTVIESWPDEIHRSPFANLEELENWVVGCFALARREGSTVIYFRKKLNCP